MILPPDVTLYEFAKNKTLHAALNPDSPSWWAWDVVFQALSQLPLNKKEQKFWGKITGGLSYNPKDRVPSIVVFIIGRKGGKSTKIGQIGDYHSLKFDPVMAIDPPLSPGEWARILIVSPASRASRVTIDFCDGQIDALVKNTGIDHPVLKRNFSENNNELILSNRCIIQTQPVNRVSGRGPSTYILILEEAAHFKKEGHFSDSQVFKAIRPGMSRFGKLSRTYIVTSPDTKEGLVWFLFKKYFGVKNNIVLVIQAPSIDFNPLMDEEFLSEEQELFSGEEIVGVEDIEFDEDYYKREYEAQFTDASSAAFSSDAVEECVVTGRKELKFNQKYDHLGFVDPSGLSPGTTEFNDEFAAGTVHVEEVKSRLIPVINAIRAWSPDRKAKNFATPAKAIKEATKFYESYDLEQIWGDEYSGKHAAGEFVKAGLGFEYVDLSKSDLYSEFIPVINNQAIQLPDEPRANAQLKGLERTRAKGDRDNIDHPKRRKDDRANVYAGLSYIAHQYILALSNSIFRNTLEKIAIAKHQAAAKSDHKYGAGIFWPKDTGFVVLSVIDSCCQASCFQLRSKKTNYEHHLREIRGVVRDFDIGWIIADRERIGEPLFDDLQRASLPIRPFESKLGKNFAIEALIAAAEKSEIKVIPDRYLLREMRVFICEQLPSGSTRYKAFGYQGGSVFALALAWQGAAKSFSLSDVKLGSSQNIVDETLGEYVEDIPRGDDFREML